MCNIVGSDVFKLDGNRCACLRELGNLICWRHLFGSLQSQDWNLCKILRVFTDCFELLYILGPMERKLMLLYTCPRIYQWWLEWRGGACTPVSRRRARREGGRRRWGCRGSASRTWWWGDSAVCSALPGSRTGTGLRSVLSRSRWRQNFLNKTVNKGKKQNCYCLMTSS